MIPPKGWRHDEEFIDVVWRTPRREKGMSDYQVKDSGQRKEFEGGMVRDTDEGKINYSLCYDGPMFKRWAEHLTKGAVKYKARNWMLAEGEEEYIRARESLSRHFQQYLDGDLDEDHAAAIFFNINEMEYIVGRLGYRPEIKGPKTNSEWKEI